MISPNFKLILHVLHMGPCPPAVGVHKMYCHPLHGLLLLLVSHGISQHQNILEVICGRTWDSTHKIVEKGQAV